VKKSLYDLIGVPPVAPREMIASACRRRIAQLEREATDAARAEKFAIREAWSILGDEKLRAGYDASLVTAIPGQDSAAPPLDAAVGPAAFAHELLKPRRLLSENWERYRKLVFILLFVGLMAISAVFNRSNRIAHEMRIEAATYEAETGEPHPRLKKAAPVEEAKPVEAFSAEKFEQELRDKEAAIKDQVAKEQTAKEDEFREQLQRENDPYQTQGRRRTRSR
jgi:curved DNA-binding protein CbpA